jgi:hypothetical protein
VGTQTRAVFAHVSKMRNGPGPGWHNMLNGVSLSRTSVSLNR